MIDVKTNSKLAGFAVPHSSSSIGWVGVVLELGWNWVGLGSLKKLGP